MPERWLGLSSGQHGSVTRALWGPDAVTAGPRLVVRASAGSAVRVVRAAVATLDRAAMANANGSSSAPLIDLVSLLSASAAELTQRTLLLQARWTSFLSMKPASVSEGKSAPLQFNPISVRYAPKQRLLSIGLWTNDKLLMHPSVAASAAEHSLRIQAGLDGGVAEATEVGKCLGILSRIANGLGGSWLVSPQPQFASNDIASLTISSLEFSARANCLAALASAGGLHGLPCVIAGDSVLTAFVMPDLNGCMRPLTSVNMGNQKTTSNPLSMGPLRLGRILAQARSIAAQRRISSVYRCLKATGINCQATRGAVYVRSLGEDSSETRFRIRLSVSQRDGNLAMQTETPVANRASSDSACVSLWEEFMPSRDTLS